MTAGRAVLLAAATVWFLPLPGYDPVRQTVSEIAFRPGGWLVSLSLALAGIACIAGGRGWSRVAGMGLLGVGLVPLSVSPMGHAAFAIPMLCAMALALPSWPLRLAALALIPLIVSGIGPAGLEERVLFAAWLPSAVSASRSPAASRRPWAPRAGSWRWPTRGPAASSGPAATPS